MSMVFASTGHAGSGVRTRSRSAGHGRGGSPDPQDVYLPPGWPEQVAPPGTERMESDAAAFLLDCCPPDYRAYPLLRRQPVVLARFAADHVEGQIRSTRQALAGARTGLADVVSLEVLDGAVDMLQQEEARLVRLRRAVALVEEALRGNVFVRRL
ncbi:MAG: hypothetical protein WAX29_05290 [Propionibacterium sp.]